MMFRGERAKRYRQFERQFRLCSKEEQLSTIIKLIFAYSEDVFISKKAHHDVIEDPSLKTLAQMSHNYSGYGNSAQAYAKVAQRTAVSDFTLSSLPEPPGLLSVSFALSPN